MEHLDNGMKIFGICQVRKNSPVILVRFLIQVAIVIVVIFIRDMARGKIVASLIDDILSYDCNQVSYDDGGQRKDNYLGQGYPLYSTEPVCSQKVPFVRQLFHRMTVDCTSRR